MGRVCVGRLCYGPSLQWAEFAMLTGRFGPIHVRISGRFGPIPFRSGRFGLGRFGPIIEVGRFGPILVGRFGPLYFIGNNKYFWSSPIDFMISDKKFFWLP